MVYIPFLFFSRRFLPALRPINSVTYNRLHYNSTGRHTPLTSCTWKYIEKDLHNKAKVLRNNNMVMGHMSAFENEYKRSAFMNPNMIY